MILIERLSSKGYLLGFNTEDKLVARECTKCRDFKSIEEFHTHSKLSYGYNTHCKSCQSKEQKSKREANPEKGKIRAKEYYEKNREKVKAYVREYRLENLETIKEKKKVYLEKVRTEQWWKDRHTEKRKKQCKNWRSNNPNHVKDYNKTYKTENKELCSRISRRRISSKRTRNLNLPIGLKDELANLALEVQVLNKEAGYRAYHLDHIIPLNHPLVSGLHVSWNCQIITATENCSKSNKFDGTYENTSWKKDL